MLTPGPVIVGDAVTPKASVRVLLHQAERVVEAGVVLALLHPVLAVSPSPGERTHAEEIPCEIQAVTLIEAGVSLALVNVDLTSGVNILHQNRNMNENIVNSNLYGT